MNKTVKILAKCAFGLWAVTAGLTGQAQILDKVQLALGGFLEFVPIKFPNGTNFFSAPPLYYGINLTGQYVYTHSNDMYSLGVSPGLTFSFNYNSVLGTSLLLQTPVFLTARVGMNCTNFNESKFGAGVGAGFNFTYITLPFIYGSSIGRISQGFLGPAAMAEVSARINGAPASLRFHINLLPIRANTELFSSFQKVPIDYTSFGIGLIYYFNIKN